MSLLKRIAVASQICFRSVMFGPDVIMARGKLAGGVTQRGRYGPIQRELVIPVNPQTTLQQSNRGQFASLSSAWRSLTEPQRQSWISAAPTFPFQDWRGRSQTLTGNSLYQKLNKVLAGAGIAANASAPAPVAVPLVTAGVLTGDESASTLSLAFDPSPVPADFEMIVEATPQVSAGIYFMKDKYVILTYVDAAGTTPVALGTLYEAMFGDLTEGLKIGVRVRFMSKLTGQIGIATETTTIVVA